MLPSPTFFLAALVLAVTPGPGIACVVARTAGGRAEGLASCVGTGLGGMFHVCAAALGLSLLLAQSAAAFSVVQYVVMGSVCAVLNTLVDVGAVLGAARLLRSERVAQRRARLLSKVSGITLVGLGLYVAAARRGD